MNVTPQAKQALKLDLNMGARKESTKQGTSSSLDISTRVAFHNPREDEHKSSYNRLTIPEPLHNNQPVVDEADSILVLCLKNHERLPGKPIGEMHSRFALGSTKPPRMLANTIERRAEQQRGLEEIEVEDKK